MSIAQSIISQALPALSPRLSLSFSPKSSDRTRLVDSQSYNLEMNKFRENASLQANLTQLEATINVNEETEMQTPKPEPTDEINKAQGVVTPNKWPLKPGVLVHVNSNHTLSPKNQNRLQTNLSKTEENEEANLGLLERKRKQTDEVGSVSEYSKKNGKPRRHTQNVVTGLIRNLRKKNDNDSDDESGKYKKINKSNKRAVSLVNLNKTGYAIPKSRLRSFFQSEAPNVIVTEGGSLFFHLFYFYKNTTTTMYLAIIITTI